MNRHPMCWEGNNLLYYLKLSNYSCWHYSTL